MAVTNLMKGNACLDVKELKRRCPLPVLMRGIGLGDYARPSCRSPWREDKNPSWGIFQLNQQWFWKDHGTGESGDEVSFLARWKGWDVKLNFGQILEYYAGIAGLPVATPARTSSAGFEERPLPDQTGFGPGTPEQLRALARLRGFELEGLQLATHRGLLVFGQWHGKECFGVRDQSGRVLELRRLDGRKFLAVGELSERKSHAVRGSQKSWPVGLMEASQYQKIMLVEGIPDFLQAHGVAVMEGREKEIGVVGMLSASPAISEEALYYFQGKQVRIYPHAEAAGHQAARRWHAQLINAGAKVDLFAFYGMTKGDGSPVKDLLDFMELNADDYHNELSLWRITP